MSQVKEFIIPSADEKEKRVAIILLVIFSACGTLDFVLVGHIQWATIILWSMGVGLTYGIYITKIANRPLKISIENDGIRLFYRKRDKYVTWAMLRGVYLKGHNGAIRISGKIRYIDLSGEAIVSIQNTFREKTGNEAPIWDGKPTLSWR